MWPGGCSDADTRGAVFRCPWQGPAEQYDQHHPGQRFDVPHWRQRGRKDNPVAHSHRGIAGHIGEIPYRSHRCPLSVSKPDSTPFLHHSTGCSTAAAPYRPGTGGPWTVSSIWSALVAV